MIFFVKNKLIIHIYYNKQKSYFFYFLFGILIMLVNFLCATRIYTGSVSWFDEVDPDLAKWYGSDRNRIHNTGSQYTLLSVKAFCYQ